MKRWREWLAALTRWAWRRLARPPTSRVAGAAEDAVPGAVCAILRRRPGPAVVPGGEAGKILAAHHAHCRSAAAYAPLAELAAQRGVVIHACVEAGGECALFVVAAPAPARPA